MTITGTAAVIIGMILGAEVVLGRMPIVDRTRLARVLKIVAEAPLNLAQQWPLSVPGFEAMASSRTATALSGSTSPPR